MSKNFNRLYEMLTGIAYSSNKRAKCKEFNTAANYKTKHNYILKALETITKTDISTINYIIEKQEDAFSITFNFLADVKYKQVKFHLPLNYENDLNKYIRKEN